MNIYNHADQSCPSRSRHKSVSLLGSLLTAAAGIVLFVATGQAEGDRAAEADAGQHGQSLVAHPQSKAYGKSLKEWLSTYWRWTQTGQDPAGSVVDGVLMMPLPASQVISGSGTPEDPSLLRGRLEITIDSETPFVLPLAAWLIERYSNCNPDDPMIDNDVFLNAVSPRFTIDNRLVISDRNEEKFYVSPAPFTPIATYPAPTSYGSVASTGFQCIGLVVRPLSVGVHVLHLDEPYILPPYFGGIFDNTWVVTVKKANGH